MKEMLKKAGIEVKQLIVGVIILIFAAVILISAFWDGTSEEKQQPVLSNHINASVEQAIKDSNIFAAPQVVAEPTPAPENTILSFTATTEREFEFQIFYTIKPNEDFDEGKAWFVPAEIGTHEYNIVLPMSEIYRIRIDFGSAPGRVNIKDIYLKGIMQADLNDFTKYSFSQLDDIQINRNGLSFVSEQEDPMMVYEPLLLKVPEVVPENNKQEASGVEDVENKTTEATSENKNAE